MNIMTEANTGTVAVRDGHQLDAPALLQWMRAHVAGFEGPMSISQFKGGQSNPTYKIDTPRSSYVLRRKPPGPLLRGAHDVEREARVLQALNTADFPVARVYAICSDPAIIGSSFYIMEMVAGRIFWDAAFPQVSRSERPAYFEAMSLTLATLHGLNYPALGLEDFGKPGNYVSRQILRWSKQYLEDVEAGRDPHMDEVLAWLPSNIPPDATSTLIHGDFRCDNLIFHPSEPRIVAVLDWELSTLGDPLADFAYHAIMYRMPPNIVAGLQGVDLRAMNIPTEEEYIESYCVHTGRSSIATYSFYTAFNFFRLAAIFHGIKGRVIRGTATSAHARERAESFPVLSRLAWENMQACATCAGPTFRERPHV